jgi:hypothetical protein
MNDDYDTRLEQIQTRNDFILGHFVHTWRGRVSDDTLYQHVLNIQNFTDRYLNYSAENDELRSADQITDWDVYDFIIDWLPDKCWVTSERRIKNYLASFKKYVQFMGENGYLPAETVTTILQTLKEDREHMIRSAATYYDEPDESQSPEAFQARIEKLVEQWEAIHPESEKGKETTDRPARR